MFELSHSAYGFFGAGSRVRAREWMYCLLYFVFATSFPFLSPFSRIHPVITRVLAFILCVLLYHTHSGISLDKSTFLSLVCPENMTSCSLFEKLCRYQREDVHHQLTSTLIWVLDVTCLTMNINLHVKSL